MLRKRHVHLTWHACNAPAVRKYFKPVGACNAGVMPAASAVRTARAVGADIATEVPPLPPHITLKRAKAFASSLIKGDPAERSVVVNTARQAFSSTLPGKDS
jgi:hypothetical protein